MNSSSAGLKIFQPNCICLCRESDLYCERINILRISELSALLSVKSIRRYVPPNDTAALARFAVKGRNLSPLPPASITARTSFVFIIPLFSGVCCPGTSKQPNLRYGLEIQVKQSLKSSFFQIPWRITPRHFVVVIWMRANTLHAIGALFRRMLNSRLTSASCRHKQVKFFSTTPAFHKVPAPIYFCRSTYNTSMIRFIHCLRILFRWRVLAIR